MIRPPTVWFTLLHAGAESRSGVGRVSCKSFILDDEFREDGFAVFAIDPREMNGKVHGIFDPVDVAANPQAYEAFLAPTQAQEGSAVVDGYSPLCVYAPHVSTRIRAQSGVFTLHGRNVWPLDYYDVLRPIITKVFLPFTATAKVKQGLESVGVNRSFIYPGLDTIALDLAEGETGRHLAERATHFASIKNQ
jgi:hypothetical protein